MPPKKKVKESKSQSLIDALKFVAVAQRDTNNPLRAYCKIADHRISASDGIITASHKIEEDLEALAHTAKLISALSNCRKAVSITQMANNTLTIKSGKYFAVVPCHGSEISDFSPDEPTVDLSNEIKDGFSAIAHLAQEGAQSVMTSSILLQSGSMVSTNGAVVLEYWHGLTLPTLIVPKVFASAVASIQKNIAKLGFGASSLTIWFEDDSWLKTQIFAEPWQDMSAAFVFQGTPKDLPKDFFTGLRAIEDFCEDGREKGSVYLSPEGIHSHRDKTEGASYSVSGLTSGCYNIRQLKNIEKCCERIVFGEHQTWFFGDGVRGVIMAVADGE